jgi:hypothetical protein
VFFDFASIKGVMAMTPSPAAERRRWIRYPANLGTFWQTVTGQEICYSARVQDLSQGGVRLLVNQRFEPGTLLRILLNKAVEARLVHATPTPDHKWALGCEFTMVLSEQEVESLLQNSGRQGSLNS